MGKNLFAESVHGTMHREREMPREDAVGTVEGDGFSVFVTADGHGDRECVRSARGAELAVSVSIDKLTEFYHVVAENDLAGELLDPKKVENRMRKLIGSIIGSWNIAVCQDAAENPFTEEEIATAVKCGQWYRNNEHVSHAYGTTLLAGLLTEKYLLLLHQGDGHCIVIDSGGNTVEPVPWDEKCIANIVTSVCDENAVAACRYAVIPVETQDPIACFLASDGVDDSFATMEETYAFCHKLAIRACEDGISRLQEELAGILEELSARGSRDDTTISGFIDVERCRSYVKEFQQYDARLQVAGRLKRVEEKLQSMSRKKAYLEEQARKASEKRRHLDEQSEEKKSALTEMTRLIRETREKLAQSQAELDASAGDYEKLRESAAAAGSDEEKAIAEREAYLETYRQYEAERERLQRQISEMDDMDDTPADENGKMDSRENEDCGEGAESEEVQKS